MGFCPKLKITDGVLSVWGFVLWDFALWGFVRVEFCPVGFCPVGFCQCVVLSYGVCYGLACYWLKIQNL